MLDAERAALPPIHEPIFSPDDRLVRHSPHMPGARTRLAQGANIARKIAERTASHVRAARSPTSPAISSATLGERLHSAGHRADQPTVWIWEGVTLYLDDAALRATLATIDARSAANSTLIVEYHDAEASTDDPYYANSSSRCGPSHTSESARNVECTRTWSPRGFGSKRTSVSPSGAPRSRAPRRDPTRGDVASPSRRAIPPTQRTMRLAGR